MKLSKAQLQLLEDIAARPLPVVNYYPPARKLVEMKLAERDERGRLAITEAGKRWLEGRDE